MENENDSTERAENSDKPNKKDEAMKKFTKLADTKVNSDLICEIEKHPELWDCKSEEYAEKTVKLNAWHDILLVFFPDFDDMALSEKNVLGKLLYFACYKMSFMN